ncbi:MAG: TMEM165/GDT1 family protein [Kiritimatiellae bacterium]|nr:TMEM165/GDT1 family protein [Kiritimatiellia bacterium]
MLSLFLRSFGLVFLAEMGDKTQLSTLGLAAAAGGAARHPRLAVFFGSALALVCTSAVAAGFGAWLSAHANPRHLKIASGALFLLFGALYLREGILEGRA